MLASKLKEMRDVRHLSNKQLADLSGVPLSTVTRILSKDTDAASFVNICDMVKLTGVEPAPPESGNFRCFSSCRL